MADHRGHHASIYKSFICLFFFGIFHLFRERRVYERHYKVTARLLRQVTVKNNRGERIVGAVVNDARALLHLLAGFSLKVACIVPALARNVAGPGVGARAGQGRSRSNSKEKKERMQPIVRRLA